MVKKVSYTGVVTDLVERPGTAVGALWTHGDAEILEIRIKAQLNLSSAFRKKENVIF